MGLARLLAAGRLALTLSANLTISAQEQSLGTRISSSVECATGRPFWACVVMGTFAVLAGSGMNRRGVSAYLTQLMQLRLAAAGLTERLVSGWVEERPHYQLEISWAPARESRSSYTRDVRGATPWPSSSHRHHHSVLTLIASAASCGAVGCLAGWRWAGCRSRSRLYGGLGWGGGGGRHSDMPASGRWRPMYRAGDRRRQYRADDARGRYRLDMVAPQREQRSQSADPRMRKKGNGRAQGIVRVFGTVFGAGKTMRMQQERRIDVVGKRN